MMKQRRKEGTGTAAAAPGHQVAGKTGTAETRHRRANSLSRGSSPSRRSTTRAWPIAVTVETHRRRPGGDGRRADRQARDAGAAAE